MIKYLSKQYEKKNSLSCKLIDIFWNLKLDIDLKDEKQLSLISQAKKNLKKKRRKLGVELSKVLEETDISSQRNYEKFERQIEIIRQLFTLYLRVLTNPIKQSSNLVYHSLKGATKILNFVNIEFVQGMIQVLSNNDTLVKQFESNMKIILQVCETGLLAMSILSRPEISNHKSKSTVNENRIILQVDYFTKLLLKCLHTLVNDVDFFVNFNTIQRCTSLLFFKRREIDYRLVAQFAIALLSVSFKVPSHVAIGFLAIQRNLLERYPTAKEIVLGSKIVIEEESCGPLIPVIQQQQSEEFELSRPRLGWELDILSQTHYHIGVKRYVQEERLFKPTINENPLDLVSKFDPVDGELFFPARFSFEHHSKKRNSLNG